MENFIGQALSNDDILDCLQNGQDDEDEGLDTEDRLYRSMSDDTLSMDSRQHRRRRRRQKFSDFRSRVRYDEQSPCSPNDDDRDVDDVRYVHVDDDVRYIAADGIGTMSTRESSSSMRLVVQIEPLPSAFWDGLDPQVPLDVVYDSLNERDGSHGDGADFCPDTEYLHKFKADVIGRNSNDSGYDSKIADKPISNAISDCISNAAEDAVTIVKNDSEHTVDNEICKVVEHGECLATRNKTLTRSFGLNPLNTLETVTNVKDSCVTTGYFDSPFVTRI